MRSLQRKPKTLRPQGIAPYEFIANYDVSENYRYSNFWKGREYEHKAEIMLLSRIFRKYVYSESNKDQIFLDLGAGFGRLAELYVRRFKYAVLGDYSVSELKDAFLRLGKDLSLHYVALNAYKLPFKDESFDFVLSVRLAHHIRYLDLMIKEVSRILTPGGYFIFEFAHKNHLKNIVKAILRRDFKFFRKETIKVTHRPGQAQGIEESKGQISIMYNFSKNFVYQLSNKYNLNVKAMYGCSYLRVPFFKRVLGSKVLLTAEKILQKVNLLITPSIFVVAQKVEDKARQRQKESSESLNRKKELGNFTELLMCPDGGEILRSKDKILCGKKQKDLGYRIVNPGIYDLRKPRPEKVNF